MRSALLVFACVLLAGCAVQPSAPAAEEQGAWALSIHGVPERAQVDEVIEFTIEVAGPGRARLQAFLDSAATPSPWCLRETSVGAGTYRASCMMPTENTTIEAELLQNGAVVARASRTIESIPLPRGPPPALPRIGATATFIGDADPETGTMSWVLEGNDTTNPTVVAPAGTDIVLTIRNGGDTPHMFQVEGGPRSEILGEAGQETTYAFTTPQTGSIRYWCPIHETTMTGEIVVE